MSDNKDIHFSSGDFMINKRSIVINYFLLIIVILLIFSLCGCWQTGELIEESFIVDLEEAEEVNAKIIIYQGSLHIVGKKQSPLLIANLSFNLSEWAPVINYQVENGDGDLKITQKENKEARGLFNPMVNDWFLLFNRSVPLNFDIIMGNGENELDLSNINLNKLTAVLGTGDTNIDLTGNYSGNINVHLVGGVGKTTLLLPKEVGVRLLIDGGINHISCDGFNQIGNFYYNSAFGFTKRNIFISIFSVLEKIKIDLI